MKKIIVCLLILVISCSTPVELTGETKEVTIDSYDWGFTQTGDEINVGDKVILRLTNSGGEHGISIPGLGIKTAPITYGEERIVEFTATKAGIYRYVCSNYCGVGHGAMRGKLIINE